MTGRGPLTRTLILATAVIVVAAGGFAGYRRLSDPSCGEGLVKRGRHQECTGVTDGSHVFDPNLRDVSARIKAENDRAVRRPHVTIAMMVPMAPEDQVERQQTLREVQGAYLAQYRANEQSEELPAIRLVLANPGRESAEWRPVADRLVGMVGGGDHLRAVFGINLSTAATKATILRLTGKGVPVVGGPVTANDFRDIPGLFAIVPSNGEQAAALTSFNKNIDVRKTLVVEDTRPNDNYVATLARTFEKTTEGAPRAAEQFRSPDDPLDPGTNANDFAQMVNSMCNSAAETVYFAGRPLQLRLFVNALGGRWCKQKQYTVVTVSGASTLALDAKLDWSALDPGKGLTVEYATITHPDAWTTAGAPPTGGSKDDFEALRRLAAGEGSATPVGPIGPVDLNDGRTITTHDSAWTAITAIRSRVTPRAPVPAIADVLNARARMHGDGRVRGASGWICLDNNGDAYDKAVAIVRLVPQEPHIRFAGLAWPTGHPPAQDCTAPPAH
ncbi:hypothetical protein EBO15_33285 [Actinomadura harenae]|uniref:Amino acid ABC transporter substrate-binding protein n=1 Tax=Actinomadura harenae TaxID=2483351 RepID=A0A3M2LP66_9ACTN|nr:hypothetical protein EBO15_33285 [Actinomadura harenae]